MDRFSQDHIVCVCVYAAHERKCRQEFFGAADAADDGVDGVDDTLSY